MKHLAQAKRVTDRRESSAEKEKRIRGK